MHLKNLQPSGNIPTQRQKRRKAVCSGLILRFPNAALSGLPIAQLPIAESKFEKGENISSRMLSLISKLSEIQNNGTPDIEFALVRLLVRNQIDIGKTDDALHTLESLKKIFPTIIIPALCQILMQCFAESL